MYNYSQLGKGNEYMTLIRWFILDRYLQLLHDMTFP